MAMLSGGIAVLPPAAPTWPSRTLPDHRVDLEDRWEDRHRILNDDELDDQPLVRQPAPLLRDLITRNLSTCQRNR